MQVSSTFQQDFSLSDFMITFDTKV